MQREISKVFLACAIGAATGAFVALGMNRMFWWVGLLVGGAVGYLSYEWKTVLRAIPEARRAAQEGRSEVFLIPRMVLCLLNVTMLIGLPMILLLPRGPDATMWPNVIAAIIVCLLVFIAIGMLTTWHAESNRDAAVNLRKVNEAINPLAIIFWHLPRAIMAFVRFCVLFGWQLFLRIHSEIRLLCGMDAMLGAAIGYFAGSAVVGALAGGFLGVVNYTVVTERWLKRRGYLPLRA